MADSRPYPDANATEEDTHMIDAPAYPGTPRWVKVFGIIALAVVLLFAAMMLAGGGSGGHGPGRHMPSEAGSGVQTPPSGVTGHGVQRP